MYKKFLFPALVLVLAIVLVSYSTYTKGNQQSSSQKTDNSTSTLAMNSTPETSSASSQLLSLASLFEIQAVTKKGPGKAVEFTWKDGEKTVSFTEFTKNKIVFLNFWGTWCPPCRGEIPDIIKINKDLEGKDIVFIGVALQRDLKNAYKDVRTFMDDKGINYINFIGNNQLKDAYGGVGSVPTTFIIDKSGTIKETIVGSKSKEAFMEVLKKYLPKK
jgi:thiol-disulfide isomerase/thioredoxin